MKIKDERIKYKKNLYLHPRYSLLALGTKSVLDTSSLIYTWYIVFEVFSKSGVYSEAKWLTFCFF